MSLSIIDIDRDRPYPPRVSEFTRTFWKGLLVGEFRATRCNACSRFSFPPRTFCRHCWSRDTIWSPMSGKGRLYSQTLIHARPEAFVNEPPPLHVGLVDLVEGLRVAVPIHGDVRELDTEVELLVLRYRDGPLFAAKPTTA